MTNFDPALKGKYYDDENGNGVYDAGESGVNIWGLRTADGGVPTSTRPRTQAPVNFSTLYDYGSATAFAQKVDNSVAGQMRDCGECHVGGGAMEYIPAAQGTDLSQPGARQDLRTAAANGWFNSSMYTAYNYFIDQYDEDGDGVLGEVIEQDYSQTGVLEVDCLMCHMEGYSWSDRKDAIRTGNFDSSRAAGAGLGTVVSGTAVNYDAGRVVDDGTGLASLSGEVLNAIKATPPSDNCATCHFDMHQVDWKKRGTSWVNDFQNEVHYAIGCMACHSRKDGEDTGSLGNAGLLTGQGSSTVLGHDPGKGNAPYSSLWNKNDNTTKTCADCHLDQIAGNYGAVDPTARHAELGLTSLIVQDGRDGVRDASHLDIISCAACHTRKLGNGDTDDGTGNTHGSLYEWGTGGAMVDSTGPDAEGRVTDHENRYVERTMENNLAYAWQGNRIIPANALITMFWRDKDDNFANAGDPAYFDVNGDGQTGAMDAVNPSHVRNIMATYGLEVLTHDGVVTTSEIGAQRTALYESLSADSDGDGLSDLVGTPLSATFAAGKLKLSMMGVMFKANHNVSPSANAWGQGGCLDCHGPDKGFYNGLYELTPRELDITFNTVSDTDLTPAANKDVVPFTKVNMADYDGDGATVTVGSEKADYQFTDFHPTLFAKGQKGRSIALNVAHGANTTIRDIDRSEALWETNLVTFSDANGNGVQDAGEATLYDGSIVGTQDGIARTTRAAWIDYLNSRVDNLHNRHVAAGYGECLTCHNDGSGNISATFAVADNGFTYIPDQLGNPGTCSANACHGASGFSTENSWSLAADVEVTPYLSALSSLESDLVVTLDASRSHCDNGECAFSFDTGGGTVIGGTDDSQVVVRYPAEGDYTASVTVTDPGGESRSVAVTATAMLVEPPVPSADFATAVNGNEVTLTATLPAEVVRAYVYWGDRKRTVSVDPQTDFTDGIAYSYGRGGRDYNIKVMTIDSSYNRLYYTLSDDADLTVAIP